MYCTVYRIAIYCTVFNNSGVNNVGSYFMIFMILYNGAQYLYLRHLYVIINSKSCSIDENNTQITAILEGVSLEFFECERFSQLILKISFNLIYNLCIHEEKSVNVYSTCVKRHIQNVLNAICASLLCNSAVLVFIAKIYNSSVDIIESAEKDSLTRWIIF